MTMMARTSGNTSDQLAVRAELGYSWARPNILTRRVTATASTGPNSITISGTWNSAPPKPV